MTPRDLEGYDPVGRMRSRRPLLKRVLLAVGSTALALVLMEAAWRMLRTRGYGPTTNPHYVVHDELLGWRYLPGARARHATDEFDVEVNIGTAGFRDESTPSDAPAPVLVLGDSFAFGWGVDVEAAFPAVLGERLGVDVWNRAVSGYGTDQELLLLRRSLAQPGPDSLRVVLVLWCGNDLEESLRGVSYGRRKPRFERLEDGPVLVGIPGPEAFLAAHSHLYRSLARLTAAEAAPLTAADVARGRALVLALFRAMAIEVDRHGAALVVVSEGEPWLIEGLAALAGVHAIDVAPELARCEHDEGPVRFARDGHWNERGHRVVAEAVARRLIELDVLR